MTTEIFFYFNAPQKLHSACRLIGKHYARFPTKKTVVFCRDAEESQQLDTLLWRFKKISFIPHVLYNAPGAQETPIIIIGDPSHWEVPPDGPVVVNLSNEWLAHINRASLLIEVVSINEQDNEKQQARQRFRRYREQFCAFTAIDLAEK